MDPYPPDTVIAIGRAGRLAWGEIRNHYWIQSLVQLGNIDGQPADYSRDRSVHLG